MGVLDTGINGNHLDLINNINTTLSCNFTNIDTFDEMSQSNESNENALIDNVGHGTHVAGIIGAQNANIGIKGVCQNVSLVSLKVAYDDRTTNVFAVTQAIYYAKRNDLDILNMSLNLSFDYQVPSTGLLTPEPILKTAIQDFDGLIVCSAGNDSIDIEVSKTYPASYDFENLITVGSINSHNQKSEFSNYGDPVDIYVVGESIISTSKGKYEIMSGTSMSSPFVAGVAALLKSCKPDLTASEIKQIILDNAISININNEGENEKILDAFAALNALHSHSYHCNYYNNSLHRYSCTCGYSYYENHIVPAGTTLLRAKCIECNEWIDLKNPGVGQMSYNIYKYSKNGSYIMSNGVIILAPSDIVSFYEGTLDLTCKAEWLS